VQDRVNRCSRRVTRFIIQGESASAAEYTNQGGVRGGTMPQATDTAHLVLKGEQGELTVTRSKILQAIAEFDKSLRGKVANNRRGCSIEEDGKRYEPKWILKLATAVNLGKFSLREARETLSALGFKLAYSQPNGDDDDDGERVEEEAIELTFGIERDLQRALRDNIGQLEPELKTTDGGKEKTIHSGRIDITAVDAGGATVVIELKTGEADRYAIGQILAYMGDLAGDEKVRGILVARDFSQSAVAAARVVPGLQLRKYNFKFAFEIVGAG
jgi:hypothetical protein